MEEKKYAFYAQGNGRIKTMEDLLQHGDLKQIRLAEISQEYGDDVSAHGTPIYETITHLKDVESDEQYTVHSHDLFKRAYVFAETENMDKMLENCIQVMEGRMVALQKELQQLKKEAAMSDMDDMLAAKEDVNGVSVVAAEAQADSMDSLRELADTIMDKVGSGVVLLGAVHDGKVNFVCKVAKADTKKGLHAGKIIKAAAQAAGGNGGGRPDMAQAGGKAPEKLAEALKAGKASVSELIG